MTKAVTVAFDGIYDIEIQKDENGIYTGAIITKKEHDGSIPILSFPVKLIQEHKDMGVRLEFNSKDIFVE